MHHHRWSICGTFVVLFLSTWIGFGNADCLVNDIMYTEGQGLGHIGLECTGDSTYDGTASTCGPNGTIVEEERSFACTGTVPYCVQCGPRGRGNALCLSTNTTTDCEEEPEKNNDTAKKCCDPETGPGGCPDENGSFDRCWDEGGYCCSDGNWYADAGDGSNDCQDNQLEDSQACETTKNTTSSAVRFGPGMCMCMLGLVFQGMLH